ncbi:MFS transporter [Ktedonosporobacter rubrisoli]|uniref:MFS transporter n=1 Tax=Ktedonosporobacter rubrisoli TaxID=2509675 RepID=A0A4V0Z0C2_KTERU|nr:MFS transporter [Ktedonosporobacter rubrisoli]QBD82711.1 MFS transporter [Ktedonosporobacter rubrisoli]
MRHYSQKLLALSRQRFLLINRNYTILWLGSTISLVGDVLFMTVLTLWIGTLLQNQSYAPLAISGIALSAALPALLIGPFAGVFVDRWHKQKTMRVMDVMRALLVLSLLPLLGPDPLPFLSAPTSALSLLMKLGATYLVVAATSSLSQFFNPSTKALLGWIVPEEKLPRAFALTTGTAMIAWSFGSALAGICYAYLGVRLAITLNAASFICSWLLIGCMRVSEPAASLVIQKERLHYVFKELWEGLRCIEEKLLLRTLLRAESLLAFGLGIINTLAFFFITQNLHVPLNLYGLFISVPSLGGIVGIWFVGWSVTKTGHLRVYYTAMLLAGIAMILIALQSQPLLALIGMVLSNIAQSCAEALVGPLLLSATPGRMEGRVFSTFGTATTTCSLLATFLSGYLGSTLLQTVALHFSAIDLNATSLLNICAGMALIAGGLYVYRHRDR